MNRIACSGSHERFLDNNGKDHGGFFVIKRRLLLGGRSSSNMKSPSEDKKNVVKGPRRSNIGISEIILYAFFFSLTGCMEGWGEGVEY